MTGAYIGLGTFEVFVYDVEQIKFMKDGKESHVNIARSSVGDIMVNDDIFNSLIVGKQSLSKAMQGLGKASPALLYASMYQNKDTMVNKWSLSLPSGK